MGEGKDVGNGTELDIALRSEDRENCMLERGRGEE